MTGRRQARRNDLVEAITSSARAQIAVAGAANLSLRAIARDLGMVSSAVYRYFPSRDDLLTTLIIESYDALGAALEATEERTGPGHASSEGQRGSQGPEVFARRWSAACTTAREWALAHPAEYGLIFGTPVPGYAAPADTIGPATRYSTVLLRLLVDLESAGYRYTAPSNRRLTANLRRIATGAGLNVSAGAMAAGLTAWTNVFGAISFELFGHLHNVIDESQRTAMFTHIVDRHAQLLVANPPDVGRPGTDTASANV